MLAPRKRPGRNHGFIAPLRWLWGPKSVYGARVPPRGIPDAVQRFSRELPTLSQVEQLGTHLTTTLLDGFKLTGAALYLKSRDAGALELTTVQGRIDAPAKVGREWLDECQPIPGRPSCDGTVPCGGWNACIPIRVNGSGLGLIAVGSKSTGAAIDESERTLLTMLAGQLAVALKGVEYVRRLEQQREEIAALRQRLEREQQALRVDVPCTTQFTHIIGTSPALQRALHLVEKIAPTDATVLITGETGTGKELIARAVHELSRRRTGPLISVNCPAIPLELAESELFGHERGAFTGAVDARAGKLELAHGGTIFLDEVADLSLPVQVKLLRVLQEREVQRVGGHKTRQLDIRIVAATNRDLRNEARCGRFREDLYYRLAALPIQLPPVRERAGDIPMLASFFLDRAAATFRKDMRGFAPDALEALEHYAWPGNVRELQHVIERAVLLCGSDRIHFEHLADLTPAPQSHTFGESIRAEKLRRVEQALAKTHGNQSAAARLLGMSRSNLARLIKSLGVTC